MKASLFVVGCLASVAFVSGQSTRSAQAADVAGNGAAQRAIVNQYCVGCHNAKLKTANLLLDQLDLAHLGDHAEIGEKVVRKLRAGMMPPSGMPRPGRRHARRR